MRRLLFTLLSLAVASVGLAQETLVPEHPCGSKPNAARYRYDYRPAACPAVCSPIPMCETRRMLCDLVESPRLSKRVEQWTDLALAQSEGQNKADVFVTYLEMCSGLTGRPRFGHFHGNEMQFPSSIAKLFYSTALFHALQDKKIPLNRALEVDLIRTLHKNDHVAANRLIDFLTGTASGGPLGYPELKDFAWKRDYANWFYTQLGFENFNVNQKIWPVPPPPNDLQLLGEKLYINYENSNRVTTNHVAALLYLLDQEAIVSRCASQALKAFMFHPLEQKKIGTLSGMAYGLPVGSTIISINGYTTRNYHEAAIITLPNHKHYVLVAFTKYEGTPGMFVPLLSSIVAHRLMVETGDDEPSDYLYARPLTGR